MVARFFLAGVGTADQGHRSKHSTKLRVFKMLLIEVLSAKQELKLPV